MSSLSGKARRNTGISGPHDIQAGLSAVKNALMMKFERDKYCFLDVFVRSNPYSCIVAQRHVPLTNSLAAVTWGRRWSVA